MRKISVNQRRELIWSRRERLPGNVHIIVSASQVEALFLFSFLIFLNANLLTRPTPLDSVLPLSLPPSHSFVLSYGWMNVPSPRFFSGPSVQNSLDLFFGISIIRAGIPWSEPGKDGISNEATWQWSTINLVTYLLM